MLIITGSGFGKTNSLFDLISQQPDIDKNYSYAKYPFEVKNQLLINKQEGTRLKYLNDSKAFIEWSNDMGDIYKNIEKYNPNKKCKNLIVFDDMIADILSTKKCNPILSELFIRVRKLNIPLAFVTQSYFAVTKSHLIICQILTLKDLWIFTKNVLQNHILF